MNIKTLTRVVTRLVTDTTIAVVIVLSTSSANGDPVAPDSRIQTELLYLDSITSGPETEETAKEMGLVLYRLRKLEKPEQPGYLTSQLIYYAMHSKNELSWVVVGHVISVLSTPQSYQVAGVVPFLTDIDPDVRNFAIGFLAAPLGRDGHAEFSSYIPYMDSSELTLWMYKQDPAGALQASIERSFRIQPPETQEQREAYGEMKVATRWALHILDNALWDLGYGYITDQNGVTRSLTKQEQNRYNIMAPPGLSMVVNAKAMAHLNILSRRPEWYARLYVASFIQKHPAFRTVELTARLQNDPNQLVNSIITDILKADAEMEQLKKQNPRK